MLLGTLGHAKHGKEWLRARLPRVAWQVLHKINVGMLGASRTNSEDGQQMADF
jgi:hypothetical protein